MNNANQRANVMWMAKYRRPTGKIVYRTTWASDKMTAIRIALEFANVKGFSYLGVRDAMKKFKA